MFYFFFFFQAEDGIRDADVTGVQTCALPISSADRVGGAGPSEGRPPVLGGPEAGGSGSGRVGTGGDGTRREDVEGRAGRPGGRPASGSGKGSRHAVAAAVRHGGEPGRSAPGCLPSSRGKRHPP